MQNTKQLLVEEGLLYDEFVIKGDNDYLELCNYIMIKYNEMRDKYDKLFNDFNKCNRELIKLKKKKK